MRRRDVLGAGVAAGMGAALLSGCAPRREIAGGFNGISVERGHLLRSETRTERPAPSSTQRTRILIAGGGIAGLAAARALRLRGIDDYRLLELEDQAGGNSRSGAVNGIACPLGAHYLPVPGNDAHEVQDLLEELGLRKRVAGRWTYDERHLCHSPQERLFFNGQWQEGLLPVQEVSPATIAQYQRFAKRVEEAQRSARFVIPASRQQAAPLHQTLDALTFDAWLTQQGMDDPHLRWYLDYCCRDDYGAGPATVSAWAGIHYFASRHGFWAPGLETTEREGVLTWPQGNGWLAQQLAAPLGERLLAGRVVSRISQTRHGVEVDAYNVQTRTTERWQADHCIVALPVFIAARVVQDAPGFLREAATRVRYAPWAVANIHIREPLHDRPGAPPSWDNVIYGAAGLGYVNAMHQSLRPDAGPTVLTCYRALGDLPDGRRQLLEQPWAYWRDTLLAELSAPHPDLPDKATRIDVTRYGHAMAIPVPGRVKPPPVAGRLSFAHSDWAGYSIFEEAFTFGHLAAASLAR
ncbi:MAG: FAD-dependent oxidoreductase [Bdellovibrionales bacterium]|nr:FAD-dependent oxidoreductase [Ramlibacter sp.]